MTYGIGIRALRIYLELGIGNLNASHSAFDATHRHWALERLALGIWNWESGIYWILGFGNWDLLNRMLSAVRCLISAIGQGFFIIYLRKKWLFCFRNSGGLIAKEDALLPFIAFFWIHEMLCKDPFVTVENSCTPKAV